MKYFLFKKFESERESKNNTDVIMNNDSGIITQDDYIQNNPAKKSKRYRSAFTTEQINYLENEFKKFRYIGNANRKEVANVLNISERAVKIWFQNRRMKEKREAGSREINLEDKYKIKTVLSNEQLNNRKMQLSIDRHHFNRLLPTNHSEYSKESNLGSKKSRIVYNESYLSKDIKQNTNAIDNKDDSNLERNRSVTAHKLINDKRKSIALNSFKKEKSFLTHYNKELKNKVNNLMPLNSIKVEKEMVQDLSLNGTITDRHHQSHIYPAQSNPSQRFVPFYTQNYYVPQTVPAAINSSNVIWKPISLMPIMPGVGSSPVTMTHNNAGFSLNRDITKGTCNCHSPPHDINSRIQCDARIQPQYVIAVPFSNPLHKY